LRDVIADFARDLVTRAEQKMFENGKEIKGKIVNDLIEQIASLVGLASDQAVTALTTLREAIPKLDAPATALDRSIAAQLDQMRADVTDIQKTLEAVKRMLVFAAVVDPQQSANNVLNMLTVVLNGTKKSQLERLAASGEKLKKEFADHAAIVESGVFEAVERVEQRLMVLFGKAMAARDVAKAAIITAAGRDF
jgi:hypothetical protein